MGKKGHGRPYRSNLNRFTRIAAAMGCISAVLLVVGRTGFSNGGSIRKMISSTGTPRKLDAEHVQYVRQEKGWHTVNVYVGDPKFLDPVNYGYPQYAQSGQDELVLKLLDNKRDGYFIDLAANDAIELSNTFLLEEKNNWNGLCIEPNPQYWYRLAHRKCQIVGALVGKNMQQQVDVRFDNDVNGGIVGSKFDNKDDEEEKKGKKAGKLEKRYTATVKSIFKKFHVPKVIDFLSLDVEGAEYFVMEGFPFDEYKFRVMTVERPQPQLQKLLKQNGYKFIKLLTGFGETLWVHESMMQNKAVQEVAELKYACWDYEKRRSCDPEFMKLMKKKREEEKARALAQKVKL